MRPYVTLDQIHDLQREADRAGDQEQVVLCRLALGGNMIARERVVHTINSRRPRDEEG